MADGVQALSGEIAGVVTCFAARPRPIRQRAAHAVAHLLLLLVEFLLSGFFPRKLQVAHRGHHAQADGPAGRQVHGLSESIGELAREVGFGGLVGEVTRGEDVWNGSAKFTRGLPGFGEVHIDKTPVTSLELGEGMQALRAASSLGPTTTDSSGIGHYRQLAAGEGGFTGGAVISARSGEVEQVRGREVGDLGGRRQTVHREADMAFFKMVPDLFVLGAVKAIGGEQAVEILPGLTGSGDVGQEVVQQSRQGGSESGIGFGGARELNQILLLAGGELTRLFFQEARNHLTVECRRQQRVFVYQALRGGAVLVDRKIIDDRVHGKGQRGLQFALGLQHDGQQARLSLGFA